MSSRNGYVFTRFDTLFIGNTGHSLRFRYDEFRAECLHCTGCIYLVFT